MPKAVFLDRDGTLIVDRGYLAEPDGVELLPDVGESLVRLVEAGFVLVLVTNQSGIGRGYFPPEAVDAQHERLAELLRAHEVSFAAVAVCPHAPWDECECRKPKPGLLKATAEELGIDLRRSFMVGDKPSDVQAGREVGCRTVLVQGDALPSQDVDCDHIASGLRDCVDWILRMSCDGRR